MDIRFLTLGDQAVTVEFGNDISVETNTKVNTFYTDLQRDPIDGVAELVPTYRSLTIHYRPEKILYDQLVDICLHRLDNLQDPGEQLSRSRVVEIPVLYGGEIGVDLEAVADYHGMTPQQVIDAHSTPLHRVYMIGFWPGMPYMEAPSGFTIPRRSSPRLDVRRGAVIIQTTQTNILPNHTPTGWHIIGHTPVLPFDMRRAEPSLFRPGDWIRFVPVDIQAYREIARQTETGVYQVRVTEEV